MPTRCVRPAAVFLDRDDTLIDTTAATQGTDHQGDLGDPDLVRLLPGVADSLALLDRAGFALVVYSSQGGVARGRYPLAAVEAVNDRLRSLLARAGVRLAGAYACPFHPAGSVPRFAAEHPWRKPNPGMILTAASELDLDLALCWAVGDKPRDVESAVAAGIAPDRAILLGPGVDLPAATRRILSDRPRA
ncbi:MAG: HAD-IIIA family hydrolase [Phycisphaerae bacterium]|nr:HAD-IIIA family hydrolase [Phycisphaerae bacterium]